MLYIDFDVDAIFVLARKFIFSGPTPRWTHVVISKTPVCVCSHVYYFSFDFLFFLSPQALSLLVVGNQLIVHTVG